MSTMLSIPVTFPGRIVACLPDTSDTAAFGLDEVLPHCIVKPGMDVWYIMILNFNTSLKTYVSFKKHSKRMQKIYRPDKIESFLTPWGTMFAPCSCYFVDMFLTKTDSSRLPSPQVGTFVCDGLGWRSRTSRSTFRATIQLRLRDFSRFKGFFVKNIYIPF